MDISLNLQPKTYLQNISLTKTEMEQVYKYDGTLPKTPGSQSITLTIKKTHSKGSDPTYVMTIQLSNQNIVLTDDNYHVVENLLQFFKQPSF